MILVSSINSMFILLCTLIDRLWNKCTMMLWTNMLVGLHANFVRDYFLHLILRGTEISDKYEVKQSSDSCNSELRLHRAYQIHHSKISKHTQPLCKKQRTIVYSSKQSWWHQYFLQPTDRFNSSWLFMSLYPKAESIMVQKRQKIP